jgi:hypothetical protein
MKIVTKDLGNRESVCIVPISDMHLGDPNFNRDKLEEYLKIVREEDAYIFINGDILTSDIKDSVGDVYKSELNPQEQLEEAIKIFMPYASRILGIDYGNHEKRIYRETGLDISKILAMSLGCLDVYLGVAGIVDVSVGKNKHGKPIGYTFYITHGWANGRKTGNKVDAVKELVRVVNNMDGYFIAHSHLIFAHPGRVEQYDARTKKIVNSEQMFIGTGGYKDYGEYEESKGLPRLKLGSPLIFLNGKIKLLKAEV